MLFGIDTSGKIGEGNIYIAVVEHKNTNFVSLLRDIVRKRHRALASRRRFKAAELTENELAWAARNFDSNYSASFMGISTFSKLRDVLHTSKNWKLKILAASIFLTCGNKVNTDDMVLVDRDYSEDVMEHLFNYMKLLFQAKEKKPIIETGSSFNEIITRADIIAGCARKGKVKPRELKEKEILTLVRML